MTDVAQWFEREVVDIPTRFALLLHSLQRLHERTGHPVYAWYAYGLCRNAQQPIPEWVFAYLDRCNDAFTTLVKQPPDKVAAAIAGAMGFDIGKGKRNPFDAISDPKYPMMAAMVIDLMNQGYQLTYAREHVARLFEVSEKTVRDACATYATDPQNSVVK